MLITSTFEQYTLLDWLSDAAKAQTKPSDDTMIVDEPAKPVAGSSKHPDNMDIIDGELIYQFTIYDIHIVWVFAWASYRFHWLINNHGII